MSYLADNLDGFAATYGTEGQKNVKFGDHCWCVDFVKNVVPALKNTSAQQSWKRGKRVKRNPMIRPGTVIGFFDDNGDYVSASGKSHVAIFASQNDKGITVWHQYPGKSVHRAILYFKSENPKHHFSSESMNGDNFYIVEPHKDPNPNSF
jgi:hypothetical protein